MDAFDKADSMVRLWGGLLGVAVMVYFAYRMFFGRKKASSDRRKPGDIVAEVQGAAAGDATPGSLDDEGHDRRLSLIRKADGLRLRESSGSLSGSWGT